MPDNLQDHVGYTRSEWSTTPYFVSVVNFLKLKNVETFVDVGGCTGEVSKIILENVPSIKAGIILEPIEENYNFTVENVNDSRVKVIRKALHQTEKTISLGRLDGNVGGYSTAFDGGAQTYDCITLEELAEEMDLQFIKIDIEGGEKNIIENSTVLKTVPYLEIEFHYELDQPGGWRPYAAVHLPDHEPLLIGQYHAFLVKKGME